MRLVLISDTHGLTRPKMPDGDVLIHAGDLSMAGRPDEVIRSLFWLADLADTHFAHVIVIAGNHDFFMESYPKTVATLCKELGITYLHNTGVTVDDVTFWGSPMTPWFNYWAFGPQRGEEIRKYWNMIPETTDVLITHGPPSGVLDLCLGGNVGCADLLDVVKQIEPKLHVFGHIHEGRGETRIPGLRTYFVNASMLDAAYVPFGDPIIFDLETT